MSEVAVTIDDVLCVLDEIEAGEQRHAHRVFLGILSQSASAEVYREIEQMAEDAGTDRRLVGWEREAVLHHRAVDRLLGSERWEDEPARVEELIEADLEALLRVCAARRGRGEADRERLEGIERTLRLMLAAQRRRAEPAEPRPVAVAENANRKQAQKPTVEQDGAAAA